MKRAEILRGIEGHADLQAAIGAAILEHGDNLSERDFDRIFGSYGDFYCARRLSGDTFILSPNGPQQEALHLAHLMIAAGLITAEKRDGLVYYAIARAESN